ncbi:MAG: SAM-dependent methyltransferase, partial [Peptococcaceae bacterium]|nr:SAM-dependent methyltransferase [Peptococcaceae bacterium]
MKKLFVTGIGPGKEEEMTARARASLEAADLLCGYTGYIKLIAELYPDKEVLATPMMQELARCRAALEAADQGKTVTMICSGDAGVYGLGSQILEL